MKKQYYLSRGGSFVNYITLYHGGVEVGTEKVWDDDLPINKINCPDEEFKKYFKEKINNKD